MILCRGDEITLAELPEPIVPSAGGRRLAMSAGAGIGVGHPGALENGHAAGSSGASFRGFERRFLRYHLQRNAGHVGETARQIGIQPRSLSRK